MRISDVGAQDLARAVPAQTYPIMVLLVDDQVMVAEAVRRALADDASIDFHYCSDPKEALAFARRLGPSVILQDLVMPGVNGLDLVRQYRADSVTTAIPVIVLSVREEPTVKSDAFKVGANDYLVKLPDKIELIARIRYHSMAYLNQVQRDEAYRALRESQNKLMEANLELQRLNNVDGLTGLSNRRYFDEVIDAEWKRCMRAQTSVALLMIDVDNFKQYNDTYGHMAGDEVLKKVANAVRKSCERATDVAARFGGEEFAIVLPSTDLAGAVHLAEKVRQGIAALALVHSGSTTGSHLSVSIGVASAVPQRGDSYADVIKTADQALYEAKRSGRNRVVMKSLVEAAKA